MLPCKEATCMWQIYLNSFHFNCRAQISGCHGGTKPQQSPDSKKVTGLNELESQKYLNLLLLYNVLMESLMYYSLNLGNIPIGISVSYQVPYLEDTLQTNKLNNKKTSSRWWFWKKPINFRAIAVMREPRESPALFSVWWVPGPSRVSSMLDSRGYWKRFHTFIPKPPTHPHPDNGTAFVLWMLCSDFPFLPAFILLSYLFFNFIPGFPSVIYFALAVVVVCMVWYYYCCTAICCCCCFSCLILQSSPFFHQTLLLSILSNQVTLFYLKKPSKKHSQISVFFHCACAKRDLMLFGAVPLSGHCGCDWIGERECLSLSSWYFCGALVQQQVAPLLQPSGEKKLAVSDHIHMHWPSNT